MSARLVVQRGPYPNQEYPLTETTMSIGRSPDNEIAIQDPEVSRRHAQIRFSGGLYQLEDAGSTNGSFVNGRRVQGSVILQHGDTVQFGESILLTFEDDTAPAGYMAGGDEQWSDDWSETGAVPEVAAATEMATQYHPPPVAEAEWDQVSIPETAVPSQDPTQASQSRQWLLGCGCGFLLFAVLCVGLLFFLDAYDQGRLLYCGSLYPLFDALLGPIGFNPACQPSL